MKKFAFLVLVAAIAARGQMATSHTPSSDVKKISSALQAGPKFVTQNATVIDWPPSPSGALSGKYTRDNRGEMKSDRGDHVTVSLSDHDYDLLDELQNIAKELNSTVAAVSLAWVQNRPGVTSTIIGARTMKQLDSNLAALDLSLSTDHIDRLDKLSEPKLNFPAQILTIAPSFSNAGATVNGIESMLMPFAPKDFEDHY